MKIDQSDFDNASFAATPVRASLPEVLSPIMMPLTQGRVVFVTGAGTSIPKPTGLPSGVELASALVAWMHENGMDTIVATITDPTDLGEVCEAVVLAGNRHTLVAELSTKYPWRRARFNLCHFSLAYFYAEDGLKQSFTFNWDPQVLQASMAFDAVQLAAPSTSDEVASAISPMFFHLHGSIEHPETLAFSQAEIDEPGSLKWSLPQLQAAITANEVVLIGFGVEPGYLLNSLEQMRSLHRKPPLAIVSKKSAVEFIRSSPRLAAVCDLEGAGRLIQMDACEALGELMRIRHLSVTRQIVAGGFERASALNFPDSEVQERARQALERILLDRPLRSLLRLAWQAAALGSESPQDVGIPVMKRFVEDWADIAGMLIVLASCSDIADLGAHSDGLRVQTEDGSLVDLWPLLPLRRQNAARICGLVPGNTHRFSGPSDADVPMVLLSAGAWGKPVLGRSSLIGNRSSSSLINSMREPVDAVNFQDLQERVMSLSGQHPTLADLLKV